MFKKATKEGLYARMAICGVTGGGKTYTSLQIASVLAGDKRIAVIDTEHSSARQVCDEFPFEYDVEEIQSYAPSTYIACIKAAVDAGYGCLIIDSLSHAWAGKDGVLEFKDNIADRPGKNSYTAWREAGEQQNMLVNTILSAPIHIIVTMRSKMEFVQEKNEKTGKTEIKKVGLQPVQRDGIEYEFQVVADVSEGRLTVSKTRCSALYQKTFKHDGYEFGRLYAAWLGEAPAPAPAEPAPPVDMQDPEDALLAKLLADPKTTPKMAEYLNTLRQYNCKLAASIKSLCANHGGAKLSTLMDTQLDTAINALHEEFGALADATVGDSGADLF